MRPSTLAKRLETTTATVQSYMDKLNIAELDDASAKKVTQSFTRDKEEQVLDTSRYSPLVPSMAQKAYAKFMQMVDRELVRLLKDNATEVPLAKELLDLFK